MDRPPPIRPAGDGPAGLSRKIKDRAIALGFDRVGISPVDDPLHGRAFAEWLRRGYHGEMAYLARTQAQRSHPAAFLPWARSVVSVGLSYNTAHPRENAGGLHGRVSRYAWGADYHDGMREGLGRLLEDVCREVGGTVQGRICVDVEPVLDRQAGARGGIGWFGKNTNLLAMGLGSFFFLGELFLGLELAYDRPAQGRCGRCRLCLDACPTGAFVAPYLLDARRCVSYLTIELKGAIPRELRPLMGTHVFGCDICQDVCPYNTHAARTEAPAFQPRGLHGPELLPLLPLTEAGFRARFRGSPILRAKRQGLLRNVCVALGNLRRAEAVPALVRSLCGDPDSLVRAHAAWALGRIGTIGAAAGLRQTLEVETNLSVREEIGAALVEAAAGKTDRYGNGG